MGQSQHEGSKILAIVKIYIFSPEQNYFSLFAMRYPVSTYLFLSQMYWELDALKKDPSVLPKKSSSLKMLAIK